jgi:hypothetical protein
MKTTLTTLTALAFAVTATASFAHDSKDAHICNVDPADVIEYPGYAGKQGVWYDRGEYFFLFSNEHFTSPISYKHWNKVESITTHVRLRKEDCRLTNQEIVHTESKDPVETATAVVGGGGVSQEEADLLARIATLTAKYNKHDARVTTLVDRAVAMIAAGNPNADTTKVKNWITKAVPIWSRNNATPNYTSTAKEIRIIAKLSRAVRPLSSTATIKIEDVLDKTLAPYDKSKTVEKKLRKANRKLNNL